MRVLGNQDSGFEQNITICTARFVQFSALACICFYKLVVTVVSVNWKSEWKFMLKRFSDEKLT